MIPNVTVVLGLGHKDYPTLVIADIEIKFGFEGIKDSKYISKLLRDRVEKLTGVAVMYVAPKVEWILFIVAKFERSGLWNGYDGSDATHRASHFKTFLKIGSNMALWTTTCLWTPITCAIIPWFR